MELFITILLIIINLYAFILMYKDKNKAKKHQWRTPESKLFIAAICFGSLGILLGMHLFKHKTRHWKFIILIPTLLIFQIFIVIKFLGIV